MAAGEPPYQARKKYDPVLLQSLASSGETVSIVKAEDLDPSVAGPQRSLTILLLTLGLVFSALLNLLQLILLLKPSAN